MMQESIYFDFPAMTSRVVDVRTVAERVAEHMGFPTEDVAMIGTSVWEAALNAVTHGSPLGEAQRVQVEIVAEEDDLCISITSENPEFVLAEFSPAITPIRRRGRGLIIIRAFMDDVKLLRDGRCTLVMKKKLPKD